LPEGKGTLFFSPSFQGGGSEATVDPGTQPH
jgi:hypothetical protein